ncbi:putative pectinesterase/pectinesterase inhibitor 21 [Silene latifolia]|uniref:putative pectinesterase/pectinesterase inhibitor 21 n=1 Tax=Silene latifolia TaxID=37657 RepID=UPI003D78667D
MKGKLIGLVISIIVLVGLGALLVVTVRGANKNAHHVPNNPLSTTSKAIQAICNPTDYKEACVRSLTPIAYNKTASPKDYIQGAINATINAIIQSIEHSKDLSKEANDPLNQMAFNDCKELLQFAIDELNDAFNNVVSDQLHTINEREYELKNWLSATIAYQESCIDGINKDELKEKMAINLKDASHLSSNILAIISEIVPVLNSFGLQTSNVSLNRRLLHVPKNDNDNDNDLDHEGYPSWLPSGDRKLLRRINMNNPRPNVIVAQDGSGQFRTINAALRAYPKGLRGRYVIYVKAGIYNEQVLITKDQVNIFMFGDGPRRTIVTGRQSVNGTKTTTYQSATFAVIGNGFVGKSMGFRNTAGPEGHQAVALRVQSDMSTFYNCRMDGYQDTLYTQAHRQFYKLAWFEHGRFHIW